MVRDGTVAMTRALAIATVLAGAAVSARAAESSLPRAEWGAPLVNVSHANGTWTIAGKRNIVTLNERTLALEVNAQSVVWKMPASATNDMVAKQSGKEFPLRRHYTCCGLKRNPETAE